MEKRKILIIHDRFMFCGGAERLVLDLARGLQADIATGFWSNEESFPRKHAPGKLFVLGNLVNLPGLRFLYLFWLFFCKTGFIKNYDVLIFSGNNCLSAAIRLKLDQWLGWLRKKQHLNSFLGNEKKIKKIFYCHTPVRHAYDLKQYYMDKTSKWLRPLLKILIFGSQLIYRWGFRQMGTVIANSRNVQARLKKYLHTEAQVIYPPIQTDRFKWLGQADYYLSFARTDRLKRVSDIVRAFQRLPDKKLVVASGGDELDQLKHLAQGHENIKILGWVPDTKLQELVGHCIASIYIPLDEDFGMTAVESLSAGKPVIGVDDGGLKETITAGQTGRLLPKDYQIADIVKAVAAMTPAQALSMKPACLQAAQKYAVERFIKEIKTVIDQPEHLIIGLDANQANKINRSGVEWYAFHLIENLKKISPGQQGQPVIFRLYTSQPLKGELARLPANFESRVLQWLPDLTWNLWTQLRLSWELFRSPPDIFLAPGNTLPLYHPAKSVIVVHDLGFKRYPSYYPWLQRWYSHLMHRFSVESAWRILTPSEFTKKDVIDKYHTQANKIFMTPLGFDHHVYRPDTDKQYVNQVLEKYDLSHPYLLYIGRLAAKKNILGLLKAFEQVKKTGQFSDLTLALAGEPQTGWAEAESYAKQRDLIRWIKVLGYVPEADKPALLSAAEVFVFPSFYEGFGLPVIEAMACGVPVVASSSSSLPEIAGSAALLVNPDNPADMSEAIIKIISDQQVKVDLIKKGLHQAQKYSWLKTAQLTLDALLDKP